MRKFADNEEIILSKICELTKNGANHFNLLELINNYLPNNIKIWIRETIKNNFSLEYIEINDPEITNDESKSLSDFEKELAQILNLFEYLLRNNLLFRIEAPNIQKTTKPPEFTLIDSNYNFNLLHSTTKYYAFDYYVTAGLLEFVENRFKTREEIRFNRNILMMIIALLVALAGVLTPHFTESKSGSNQIYHQFASLKIRFDTLEYKYTRLVNKKPYMLLINNSNGYNIRKDSAISSQVIHFSKNGEVLKYKESPIKLINKTWIEISYMDIKDKTWENGWLYYNENHFITLKIE